MTTIVPRPGENVFQAMAREYHEALDAESLAGGGFRANTDPLAEVRGAGTPGKLEFGAIWDRMVNLITEHDYRPVPRLIIGPAKLQRIMASATEEDRKILEAMVRTHTIIVSHHLPDPEVAYRWEPKDYRPPVNWMNGPAA